MALEPSHIKTTVTTLQELCTKHKLTVTYTEIVTPKCEPTEESDAAAGAAAGAAGDAAAAEVSLEIKSGASDEQFTMGPELVDEIMAIIGDEGKRKRVVKRKKKPPTPAPVFEIQVAVGDNITAKGQGRSKKIAKQAAATAALELLEQELKNTTPDHAADSSDSGQSGQTGSVSAEHYNPVGSLHQLTHKLVLPPVRYEFNVEEHGKTVGVKKGVPATARRVTCTASIYDLSLICAATSQKVAKKMAAEKMLALLQEANGETGDGGRGELAEEKGRVVQGDAVNGRQTKHGGLLNSDVDTMSNVSEASGDHDATSLLDAERLNAGVRLIQGKRLAPPTAEARHHSDQFYQALRARTGKTLASLEHMALNRAHTNYVQMLEEISEEQSIEIVYRELPEPSDNGQFQCLVQLTCMPVAVCHALGRTRDEARALAAHNALQYLRIVVRKP